MTQFAATMCWVAGLVIWFIIRLPHQRRARKHAIVDSRNRGGQQTLVAISVVGLGLVPAFWALTGMGAPRSANLPFSAAVAYAGIVAIIAYLWFFYRSHKDLGHNWSATLEIRAKHTLVTSGVYHYVRHPMYVSFWLMAIAQALLLQNWFVGLAGIVGVGILYFFRVKKEEKLMLDTFGGVYRDYASKTARLIPYIY